MAASDIPILQVEDDRNDVFFLSHAFEQAGIANPVQVAYDGQEAIEYLSGTGAYADRTKHPLPGLVILDLKMPRKSGLEVLQWLRQESSLRCIPVIVFSSSAREGDIEQSYLLGANSFVVKPASVEDRVRFARCLKDFWLGFNQTPPLYAPAAGPGPTAMTL